MAPQRRWFTQTVINQNKALQNTAVYWEEEVWSYPTYAIWTSDEQVCSVHLQNQHWYLSNWDDEGMYFTLGLPLPDIDSHNRGMQGRAPHKYKDIPIFTEYHTSSGSEEEDPIDEQIRWSPINLSPAIQAISTAPCPTTTENQTTTMLIATAITTQVQSSTTPGGAGPSGGGGPPGGGGGAPGGGGGMPSEGGGGNPAQATVGNGKPMGVLPTIFEGDHSKGESFLWEFSTYLLVNYDIPALASFIKRIAIALTCIKGPEVNRWTQQQLKWLMTLQPADNNNTTYQQFITNFCNHFMDPQKAQRARIELQMLKMTWPEIDEYISKFESIAHKAGYNPADHNTMQQFLQRPPPEYWAESPWRYDHQNIWPNEEKSNQHYSLSMHHQHFVQATCMKCSLAQLPGELANPRAMLPRQSDLAAATTRVWSDPFQLHYSTKIMEQPTHPNGSWLN